LEGRGLIAAGREASSGSKSRKVYSITRAGRLRLRGETYAALSSIRPTYSSVLLGMINWPALEREEALQALEMRTEAIETELTRLASLQAAQQPLPDFVGALFDHSIGQLRSEGEWVARTLDYMAPSRGSNERRNHG
jgi:hypothetical protein